MKNQILALFIVFASLSSAEEKHFSLATSAWSIANFLHRSPDYFQLNLGIDSHKGHSFFVQVLTWKYYHPLGVPYGPDFDKPEEDYPGFVRGVGFGFGYRYNWWKGLFSDVSATPIYQTYCEPNGDFIQAGFQLFVQTHTGYRFQLPFGLFIQTSFAATSWPINTNLPDSFQKQEDKWPRYFLVEPHLNFGIFF